MTKFIFCSLALFFGIAGNVVAAETEPVLRTVKITTPLHRLTIQGNLEVILVNDSSSVVTMEGKPDDVEAISVQHNNNKVVIALSKRNLSGKVIIRVPLQQLKAISLYGDVRLQSAAVLNAKEVNVFIDGDCKADLKITGVIKVAHSDNCEVTWFDNSRKTR
jgi:hypothetical protein